jgi:hypothetical protein
VANTNRRTTADSSSTNPQAEANAEAGVEKVADKVQENVDVETEQGFRGVEVDNTPNENYTVQGVTRGAPTPETDAATADEAAAHARGVAGKGNGAGPR